MTSSLERPHAWAAQSAPSVRSVGSMEGSVAIVPVGSTEQHGQHLPTGTDAILADEIAHLGAERVGDDIPVVVTPPIWTGYSPHHRPFGGTITLGSETLLGMLEDIATSVFENGFDALLLLNGHGGNSSFVAAATSTIGVEHPDKEVLSVTYFTLAAPFVDEIRDSDPGGMSHGGEFETSLMQHLHPELVSDDEMEAPLLEEPYDHALDDMMATGVLSVYRSFDEYTDTGAIGAPEDASPEKGGALYDGIGDELEALLRQVHEQPAPG